MESRYGQITHLLTRWGEVIDKDCPLPEYPRPQLKRENWRCLNGVWEYAICEGITDNQPDKYDGDILVPFSPESLLSGVERQLLPGDTLWYRREVHFDAVESGKRLLLHFGAVDQSCKVYVNGQKAGSHEGGYWPFYFDITGLVNDGKNIISISVTDDADKGIEAYGKQKLYEGGIWYTAQSGIWQTVWTEIVPDEYIESVKITPRCASFEVEFDIKYSGKETKKQPVTVRVYNELEHGGEKLVSEGQYDSGTFSLPMTDFRYWSISDPFLYTVKINAGADEVESYFGMREFSIIKCADGHPRLALNGEVIFHSGLLDQGYWSDGMYTPPADDAMIWEIKKIKELGFNMLRKHIKIEPLRWYYHCDRLGMLVWQDFVSGGGPYDQLTTRYLPFIGMKIKDENNYKRFGRVDAKGRVVFERDMKRTVDLLYNTVCLAVWVPFNEGWGQFDSVRIAGEVRALDDTRSIDHASGWHDQHIGDFASHHVYYKPFRMKRDKHKRVQALTEFGGYSCPYPGHMATEKLFGHRMFDDIKTFNTAVEKLYMTELVPKLKHGLSAAVYTQVSDIEEEVNGLFTYDRAKIKIDTEMMKRLNNELIK
ncbi:MAG: glycoside hydrolase family 2 [Oscillospiraceae bacterium]|jgi:hypothetical protein|nr:glycoside hydrolase family 2 [Oscillospiraceae bacterium]